MAQRKTSADKSTDLARRIWLAGIGAYGRAFDDAQETYEKVSRETARRFEELVEKGEGLEDTVAKAGKNLMPQVRNQSVSFEDRLDRMRRSLGLVAPNEEFDDRLDVIEERLKGIEDKLDQLISALPETKAVSAKSSRVAAKSKSPKSKPSTKKTSARKQR